MFTVRETVQESLGFSPAELVFGHTVRGPLKLLWEQLESNNPQPVSILDFVSKTHERLHRACELARTNLVVKQDQMKRRFDRQLKPYVSKTTDIQNETTVSVVLVSFVVESECDDWVGRGDVTVPPILSNSEIVKGIDEHLSYLCDAHRRDIVQLIKQFPSLFSDMLTQTNVLFHDIKGHYNVIIDYMGAHLYDYHLYEWSSACYYWFMSSYLYVRKSEYVLDIQSYYYYIFFFITQKLFLLYFSSAQINHLYHV